MRGPRVLIGCERLGRMRDAFRRRGFDAWSCDTAPDATGNPYHLQCDVLTVLHDGWDGAIFHPDCTYLTYSAEWAYGDGPYHMKLKPGTLLGAARREARAKAVEFAVKLWTAPIPKIAIENPRGFLQTRLGAPTQTIQPHQFGDNASKATCFWLKDFPCLKPTKHIAPRIVNGRPRWANQTDSGQNRLPPSADRAMQRAATYPGVAEACADQWGKSILNTGTLGHAMPFITRAVQTELALAPPPPGGQP